MIRLVIKLVLPLVIVLVIALAVALYSIDSIARRAIEVGATRVLGVPTTLESIRIGVLSPGASLRTLQVSNPAGYTDSKFLTLADGSMALDLRSLRGDVVRIPSIRLETLRVVLEQKGGESNARMILDTMRSSLGGGRQSEGGRRFVIDELLIEDIHITVRASGLPVLSPTLDLRVPTVRLESLGSAGRDPVGMDQLTAMVVNAIMQAALEAGGNQIPGQLRDGLLGGIASLGRGVPDFALSVDAGGGLRPVGDISQIANRLGVDLSSLGGALGEKAQEALRGAGEKLEDAGKSAGDAIRRGLGDRLK
ncbi:MAG: hypothetical protein KF724_01755 [Phycisphaeraceae bacterium]|nr:hypothetical protein [Phycisphaeraceae bacterium]